MIVDLINYMLSNSSPVVSYRSSGFQSGLDANKPDHPQKVTVKSAPRLESQYHSAGLIVGVGMRVRAGVLEVRVERDARVGARRGNIVRARSPLVNKFVEYPE